MRKHKPGISTKSETGAGAHEDDAEGPEPIIEPSPAPATSRTWASVVPLDFQVQAMSADVGTSSEPDFGTKFRTTPPPDFGMLLKDPPRSTTFSELPITELPIQWPSPTKPGFEFSLPPITEPTAVRGDVQMRRVAAAVLGLTEGRQGAVGGGAEGVHGAWRRPGGDPERPPANSRMPFSSFPEKKAAGSAARLRSVVTTSRVGTRGRMLGALKRVLARMHT